MKLPLETSPLGRCRIGMREEKREGELEAGGTFGIKCIKLSKGRSSRMAIPVLTHGETCTVDGGELSVTACSTW